MKPSETAAALEKQAKQQLTTKLKEEGSTLLERAMPRIEKALQEGDVREFIFLINDIIVDFAEQARHAAGFDVVKLLQMAGSAWLASKVTDQAKIADLEVNGVKIPTKLIATCALGCMINQAINYAKKQLSAFETVQRQQKAFEVHAPRGGHTSMNVRVHKNQANLLDVLFKSSKAIVEQDEKDNNIKLEKHGAFDGYPFFNDDTNDLHVKSLTVTLETKITTENKHYFEKIGNIDRLISTMKGDNRGVLSIALASVRNRYVRLINKPVVATEDIEEAKAAAKTKNTTKAAQIDAHYKIMLRSINKSIESDQPEVIDGLGSITSVALDSLKGNSTTPVVQRIVEGVIRSKTANTALDKEICASFESELSGDAGDAGDELFSSQEKLSEITIKPVYMQPPANVDANSGLMGLTASIGQKILDNLDISIAAIDAARDAVTGDDCSDTKTDFNKAIDGLVDDLVVSFQKKGQGQYLAIAVTKIIFNFDNVKSQASDGIKSAFKELSKRLFQNMDKADHAANHETSLTKAFFPSDFWGEMLQATFGRGMVPSIDDGSPPLFELPDDPTAGISATEQNADVDNIVKFIENLKESKPSLSTETDIKIFQWKQCLHNLFLDLMDDTLDEAEFNDALPKATQALDRAIEGIKNLNPKDKDLEMLGSVDCDTLKGTMTVVRKYKKSEVVGQGAEGQANVNITYEQLQHRLSTISDVPVGDLDKLKEAKNLLGEIKILKTELTELEIKTNEGGLLHQVAEAVQKAGRALKRKISISSSDGSGDEEISPQALEKEKKQALDQIKIKNLKADAFMARAHELSGALEFPNQKRLAHLPRMLDATYKLVVSMTELYNKTNTTAMFTGFTTLTVLSAASIALTPLICTAFAAASFVLPVVIALLSVVCAIAIGFVIATAVEKITYDFKHTDEAKTKRDTINNLLAATVKFTNETATGQCLHQADGDQYDTMNEGISKLTVDLCFVGEGLLVNPYAQIAADASTHRSKGLHLSYTTSTKSLAQKLKAGMDEGNTFAKEAVYSFARIMLANKRETHKVFAQYQGRELDYRNHTIAKNTVEDTSQITVNDLSEIINQAGAAYREVLQKKDPKAARRKYIDNAKQYEFYPGAVEAKGDGGAQAQGGGGDSAQGDGAARPITVNAASNDGRSDSKGVPTPPAGVGAPTTSTAPASISLGGGGAK